jgi:mannose-6-phosphate isomerase-like protein (cupin superfamily)
VTRSKARVIPLTEVDPIELTKGSWSRLLVTDQTVEGNQSSLGYSLFTPGMMTGDLSHQVEELAYVVSGRGSIRLEDQELDVGPDQALYIPASLWHTVVNDGSEDLVMVFSFPWPDYPPTERRESRA